MWYRGGKAAGASPRRRHAVENPKVDYQMLGVGIVGTQYLVVKIVAKQSVLGLPIPADPPDFRPIFGVRGCARKGSAPLRQMS